ncbi:MAG: hypothetical protein PHP50_05925 [Lachnospiraceae bacterium]|nr:hypothetical protein [Lachnospiraceae bacterium]
MDVWDICHAYGITEMLQEIRQLFSARSPETDKWLEALTKGDLLSVLPDLGRQILYSLGQQSDNWKHIFAALLIFGVVASLFTVFFDIFENPQIARMGYFLVLLVTSGLLYQIFQTSRAITVQFLEDFLAFMRISIPAFSMVLTVSGNYSTGTTAYTLLLVVLYLLEEIMAGAVLPLISVYSLLTLMNAVWEKERLSMLLELLQKGITTVLKVLLGAVTGINLLESMLSPVMDQVSGSIIGGFCRQET